MSTPRLRIGVLASGEGTNLQALIDRELGPAEIAVVVCNVPGAGAIARARRASLPTEIVDHRGFLDRAAFERALVDVLERHAVDWVVLAGFMRILTPTFLRAFPSRVLNIHPALCPAFPGVDAQRRAFEAGVRITGCTVHLVDEGVDTGPILAQVAVPVLVTDTAEDLRVRILAEEHRLLPAVVAAIARGRLRTRDTGVPFLAPSCVDAVARLESPNLSLANEPRA